MIITQFAADVRKQIRERMNELADAMAGGSCTDFAHYKSMAGEVQGLAIAERYLLDLAEAIEKQEMEKR